MTVDFSDKLDEAAAVCARLEAQSPRIAKNYGSRQSRLMDLLAADGVNGNQPLDWKALVEFDDFNFIHDVGGIHNTIDRSTGKLTKGFLPRCARMPA